MSLKIKYYTKNTLTKKIGHKIYYLDRSWDLMHGMGWIAVIIHKRGYIGYGHHKKNKFTAVRRAEEDLIKN